MYQNTTISLMVKENPNPTKLISIPKDVFDLCQDMKELAQESFQILTLNCRHKLINRHLVTLGLNDASLVHPREVFIRAIKDNAASVILVHNHPSGDANPSPEDLRITKQLIEAGKIINISVMDHVIIGDNQIVSLRESGIVAF
jgi:DNA repair protein RadC